MTNKLFLRCILHWQCLWTMYLGFLFKYGGWYLNCTYNYVCASTKYENIWTMSWYNSRVTLLTHAHFVSTTHINNISSICLLFLVIPIVFNYYKMLNLSYIYKLVWKMKVNCQCYTPDILRVFTLNLSLQKIQCDYECQLVIYKKPKECKHWILKSKCVIYLHVFYSDELIPFFLIWLHFWNWYTIMILKYFW